MTAVVFSSLCCRSGKMPFAFFVVEFGRGHWGWFRERISGVFWVVGKKNS